MQNFKELLQNIKCFIFDMDGVLTDGSLLVTATEMQRTMNIRDGYAMSEAVKNNFKVVIISGGISESAIKRFQKLGITDINMGVNDKLSIYNEIKIKYTLSDEHFLYMGDDLPDYEVMKIVGVPCCPQDAAHEIRSLSIYISPLNGGKGCVRDVIEQTLRLQNLWKKTEL